MGPTLAAPTSATPTLLTRSSAARASRAPISPARTWSAHPSTRPSCATGLRQPSRDGDTTAQPTARPSVGPWLFDRGPDRGTRRQAEIAHGFAVGDGDRVEAQVQLGREVERNTLGPLGLGDEPV